MKRFHKFFILIYIFSICLGTFSVPKSASAAVCTNLFTVGINPGTTTVVGSKIYVTSPDSNSVSVINTTTHVVTTIAVGVYPYFSTVVGSKLYVANETDGTLSVIDTTTDTVMGTIPTGSIPVSAATFGTKLYIVNGGDGTVSVIDTTTDTVIDTITVGANPYGLAVVGTKLYIVNNDDISISVIDTTTDTVINTITGFGSSPTLSIYIGTKIYVMDNSMNELVVLDTTTDTVLTSIPIGTTPFAFVFSNNKLYVVNAGSNTVSVVNTTTDTVIGTITVGNGPLSITSVGTKLYVTNENDGTVSAIDTTTDTLIDTITVGGGPSFANVVGTKLYVVNFNDNTVSVVDTTTDELYQCPNYTLTYTAGVGGSVTGSSPQIVVQGASGTTVTAVPSVGYSFSQWSDLVLTQARTDTNVAGNITVSAVFTPDSIPVTPIPVSSGGSSSGSFTHFVFGQSTHTLQPTPVQTISHNTYISPLTNTPQSCNPFVFNMKVNSFTNPVSEVRLWQAFLNKYQNEKIPLTGYFGPLTFASIKRFQEKYKDEILTPWGLTKPTGYTYKTTRAKANSLLGCAEGAVTLENGTTVNIK